MITARVFSSNLFLVYDQNLDSVSGTLLPASFHRKVVKGISYAAKFSALDDANNVSGRKIINVCVTPSPYARKSRYYLPCQENPAYHSKSP